MTLLLFLAFAVILCLINLILYCVARLYKVQGVVACINMYIHCVQKKQTLAFSFISSWKMFRFPQNFQGMFKRKLVSHPY